MSSTEGRSFRLVASNRANPRMRLYRGTALDKILPDEIAELLRGEDGQVLKSVVDIRTKEEIGGSVTYPLPDGVAYRVMQLTASGDFCALKSAAEPQVTFYRIDFYTLTKKMKIFTNLFWSNWRLALTGWRSERFDTTDGVKMGILKKLSSDVANTRGPVGLYLDWLDPDMDCSGLAAVFRLLSSSDIYPAMLHCQYGKDRTGAVCALLQMMDPCMTEDQVVDEYHLTEKYIARFIPEIETKVKRAGLPLDCARCPKDLIRQVIEWIRSRYGTVEQYLQSIGVQQSEVAAIKAILGFTEEDTESK